MTQLHVDTDVTLARGYNEFEVDTHRDLQLTFTANHVNADVFIRIKRAGKIRLRTFIGEGCEVNLLIWNDMENKLEIDESHDVLRDAALHLAYGECNKADTDRKTWVELRQNGASAYVSSASLVSTKKSMVMDVVNHAPHTYGHMRNFAIVQEGGRLYIDAVGKIVKGASHSESHQQSRAMCLGGKQTANIIPELLIDENEVQASHAMSIGRMDEQQLYYMQTRGLDEKACISLLSAGYLMPITEFINNDTLKEVLHKEMEMKLQEL